MRSLVLLSAVAVAAAACGPLPEPGPVTSNQPIQAYLIPSQQMGQHGDRLTVHVNRPAHIAVFRIVPGRGTSLVYPSPGYGGINGRSFAGLHQIPMDRYWNRDQFLPSFASTGSHPEFFFLVASETPLRTERIGAYGYGLRSALGMDFAPVSGYRTMERLASVMIANPESQNWTTDFYVHWPEALHMQPRSGLVRVRCAESTFYVPAQFLEAAYQQLCPNGDPGVEVPVEDDQPPGVVEPNRRPPVEVTERIASTQLRDPGTFSELREAASSDRSDAVERRIARQQAEERARETIRPGSASARTRPAARPAAAGEAQPSTRARPTIDGSRPSGSSRPATRPSAAPSRGGSPAPAAAPASGGSSGGERSRPTIDNTPR